MFLEKETTIRENLKNDKMQKKEKRNKNEKRKLNLMFVYLYFGGQRHEALAFE